MEPELASLRGDRDRVADGGGRDGAFGDRRADVVRLVDHDEGGTALGALSPQLGEHAGRHDGLLVPRPERAEVDDEHPRRSLP